MRSCFIITRFIDDSINLSEWYVELKRHEKLDGKSVDELFYSIGTDIPSSASGAFLSVYGEFEEHSDP